MPNQRHSGRDLEGAMTYLIVVAISIAFLCAGCVFCDWKEEWERSDATD